MDKRGKHSLRQKSRGSWQAHAICTECCHTKISDRSAPDNMKPMYTTLNSWYRNTPRLTKYQGQTFHLNYQFRRTVRIGWYWKQIGTFAQSHYRICKSSCWNAMSLKYNIVSTAKSKNTSWQSSNAMLIITIGPNCPKSTTTRASTVSAPGHALTRMSKTSTASGVNWLTSFWKRISAVVECVTWTDCQGKANVWSTSGRGDATATSSKSYCRGNSLHNIKEVVIFIYKALVRDLSKKSKVSLVTSWCIPKEVRNTD